MASGNNLSYCRMPHIKGYLYLISTMSSEFYTFCKHPSFLEHLYRVYTHILCHKQTNTCRHIEIRTLNIHLSFHRIFVPSTVRLSRRPVSFSDKSETKVVFQYAVEFFSNPAHSYELPLKKRPAIQLAVSGFCSSFF